MLDNKTLIPNVGNDEDHIFYVICGKGLHSKNINNTKLKHTVAEWL